MTVFRYLHLTDLHFCQEPFRKNAPFLAKRPWREIIDTVGEQTKELGFSSFFLPTSYDPEIAKGVAQFCSEWSDAADGIIITGDLSTTGIPSDVGVAEQFIKEPAASGILSANRFPTIASLGLPIHIFAGNHDRYINVRGRPFSNLFDFAFEEYMDKATSVVGSWVSTKQGEQLGFVHGDFTLRTTMEASFPTTKNAFGQGRVYDDVLADMRDASFAIRKNYPEAPIIWMVHFAPYECGTSLRLIDHQRLLDAAQAIGVSAIICGHTHHAMSKTVMSQTIYCGGSSCCVDNVGGCMVHVIDFEVDKKKCALSRSTFTWSEDESEFVFSGED